MHTIRREVGSNGPTRMFHVMINVYNREFRQLTTVSVRSSLPILQFQATLSRGVVKNFAVTNAACSINTWNTSDQSNSSDKASSIRLNFREAKIVHYHDILI